MPIVFVHGVDTRKGPAYNAGTLVIDAFLRKYLGAATIGGRALAATPVTTFPYWGDLGTTFAFNMASLPRPQIQAPAGVQALGGFGTVFNKIRQLFDRALDSPLPIFTEGLRLLSDGVRLLGEDSERAVERLNNHVRRSLHRSPFTATVELVQGGLERGWDVDIDYAPRV